MDEVKIKLIKILEPEIGIPIHPAHISALDNPTYPCITISRRDGGTNSNHFSEEIIYNIDVWAKVNNDELWAVYNKVKKLLNLKTDYFLCKEIYVNDDLYEESTRTHHLASRYKIIKEVT